MTTIQFDRGAQKDPVLAQASELPREIEPSRDLWPAIRAKLEVQAQDNPRRINWPMAFAAGFVVASVSALLTWSLMRDPGPVADDRALAQATAIPAELVPVNYGPDSALGALQLKARDDLLAQVRQRLDELSPETRATVIKNLAIIQHAADQIGAALAQDPASGLLNGLLQSTYRDELRIYSLVVTSGDARTRRT